MSKKTEQLRFQYASFRGEAMVHRLAAIDAGHKDWVPAKAGLKLFRAWLLYRLVHVSVVDWSAGMPG